MTWYKVFSAKIRQYFHKYNFGYEFLSFTIYLFQRIMEIICYLISGT